MVYDWQWQIDATGYLTAILHYGESYWSTSNYESYKNQNKLHRVVIIMTKHTFFKRYNAYRSLFATPSSAQEDKDFPWYWLIIDEGHKLARAGYPFIGSGRSSQLTSFKSKAFDPDRQAPNAKRHQANGFILGLAPPGLWCLCYSGALGLRKDGLLLQLLLTPASGTFNLHLHSCSNLTGDKQRINPHCALAHASSI